MGLEIFSLEGKTALVTGASRGIGEAIAIAFAEAGADVAVAARSTADLEAVAGKIAATGRKGVAITTDVTDRDQIRACVSRSIEELGRIDVLVNNAGGTRFMAPVAALREDGWDKGVALNLTSPFLFCKFVAEHMLERKSGSIINVASVGGLRGSPGLSFYGAAKAGLVSLTRTLAIEFGTAGPRANAICPGWVKTELNRNLWSDPKAEAAMVERVPMRRWGETHEMTGAAIFLASDASSYVTGTTIVLDGGACA